MSHTPQDILSTSPLPVPSAGDSPFLLLLGFSGFFWVPFWFFSLGFISSQKKDYYPTAKPEVGRGLLGKGDLDPPAGAIIFWQYFLFLFV